MAKVRIDPPQLTSQDIKRFWSHVDKSPGQGPKGNCWGWTKGLVSGYGDFATWDGTTKRRYYAHRLALFLTNGRWTTLFVCHECDWPPCCNPAHLFEGDQAANLHDMFIKGRSCRGEKQGNSKLTAPQVLEIRALVAAGIRQKVIAKQFGISTGNVGVIAKKKKSWLHI